MKRPENLTSRIINGTVIAVIAILVSGGILFFQKAILPGLQAVEMPTLAPGSEDSSGIEPTSAIAIPTPLPDLDTLLQSLPQTATPFPGPAIPARIEIGSVNIDILVLTVTLDSDGFITVPARYAGYWGLSSPLDQNGNTVIVGHNRLDPRPVFRDLAKVQVGDEIKVTDQFGEKYYYSVTGTLTFQVSGAPASEANRPKEYAQPTASARLTLITCAPDESCPSRLVVLADPIKQ